MNAIPVPRLRLVPAALLLAGCVGVMPVPAGSASTPAAGGGSGGGTMPVSRETAEVARLVNEHRARIGCRALAWDDAAARAAQAHSADMARRNYFSHTSPEGRTMVDRLRAQGASYRMIAENIAMGQPTAREVVRGWLNSPGHRQNIENCGYTRQGVGLNAGRWTHVFYTPLQ
ncbi:MAG TPA: CAP domain-containing protein [Longimicrobium sp.]|nr:CAP domain-containing protein [Longimicrobium sp.]